MRLLKGFEVELFTGTTDGTIVGLSERVIRKSSVFKREIDKRHLEYITSPQDSYDKLRHELIHRRRELRQCLEQLGNYTLIPGSVMALGGYQALERSEPANPYHSYVEQKYGTKLVTASVHINIGLSDPDSLLRAYRLIRVEAPLYLALSAASPFLEGCRTGYHSIRWHQYPQVPDRVPLFEDHDHYIRWTTEQLSRGTIHNVRQLWVSVRPNGERRPHELNRLELRICDLVTDPMALLAIAALLEARVQQLLAEPQLDPLQQSRFPSSNRAEDLLDITTFNEAATAKHSLDAILRHWRDGRPIRARDWIQSLYEEVMPIAQQSRFQRFLLPLQNILRYGNTAQQWLSLYEQGLQPRQIVQGAIWEMAQQEQEQSREQYPQPDQANGTRRALSHCLGAESHFSRLCN